MLPIAKHRINTTIAYFKIIIKIIGLLCFLEEIRTLLYEKDPDPGKFRFRIRIHENGPIFIRSLLVYSIIQDVLCTISHILDEIDTT